MSSGLKNVSRSPAEIEEYGPASIAAHHARNAVEENPAAIVGNDIPIFIGAPPRSSVW